MKAWILAGGLAVLALSGCQKKEEWPVREPLAGLFGKPSHRDRYLGVWIYAPEEIWKQLARTAEPADPRAATLADDDHIFVVMDGATGELRQCGNLSGHCIGFNPWAKPLDASQAAPALVLKHAQQIQEEADAAAEKERQEFDIKVRKR